MKQVPGGVWCAGSGVDLPEGPELRLPSYLERSEDGLGGRCTGVPDRQDIPVQVDERMVVEFYAR